MDGAHFFVLLFCSTCRVIYYGRGSAEASQLPVSPSPDGECQPDSQHAHAQTHTHALEGHSRGERSVEKVRTRTVAGRQRTHTVSQSHSSHEPP